MRDQERNCRVTRYELGKRMLELRGGDVEAMVERLARGFVDGDLVAVRDQGHEALVYDRVRASILEGRLDVFGISRDGSVSRQETEIWRGDDLEGWLEAHRDELEWVHHEWR
ncbi:hypothetical protein [Natrinema salinisoli]|uniref:hypothetical protein n=1 Tax=Natrinema salinisoli TaxID=2878535 RepID=UPI001CF08E30|nr:hypothetical protein [Natrinema salinisoli]